MVLIQEIIKRMSPKRTGQVKSAALILYPLGPLERIYPPGKEQSPVGTLIF
jgi:hypothetical protein